MVMPNGFLYILSRLLIGFGQIFLIRILTSYLNPEEIGRYYLFISLAALPSLFVITPVLTFATRHYYKWYEIGIGWNKYITIVMFIASVSALTGLAVLISVGFNIFPKEIRDLYYLVPIYVFINITSSYSQELLNLIQKTKTYLLINTSDVWMKIFFASIVGLFYKVNAGLLLEVIILSTTFFGLFSSIALKKYTNNQAQSLGNMGLRMGLRKFSEILRFSWPFSIGTIFYWCQTDGYRFVLAYTSGIEIAGKFVVGFGLGAALMVAFDTLFHQIYLPVYFKEIADETTLSYRSAWNKYAEKIIGVFVPFSMYLIFSASFLARTFLDSKYWDVSIYIIFGVACQLFRIFSGSLVNGLIAIKKTKDLIAPNFIGAFIALSAVYLFSFDYPVYGVGVSMIASYMIVFLLLYKNLYRRLKFNIRMHILVKSILYMCPICTILVLLSHLELGNSVMSSAFILFVGGLGFLWSQWILSRDIWFNKI